MDNYLPGGLRFFVYSLGCPKNSVDTEVILGSIVDDICNVTLVQGPAEADVLLVNTCGFIESAVSESIERILELIEKKREGQILVVTGCMVERYGDELVKELPEVDLFYGARAPQNFKEVFKGFLQRRYNGNATLRDTTPGRHLTLGCSSRLLSTPWWRAFVKIAEGCSNHCTYCLIPAIRGQAVSRSKQDIIDEVNELVGLGTREVTLVAQDVTAYEDNGNLLYDLLRDLLAYTDISWIRLMYTYPGSIDERILRLMAESKRICKYLDIPIQHASDRILKSMGRKYDSQVLERQLELIQDMLPSIGLRTTLMVGFPGETDDDFLILQRFIEKWRFHHLGCFIYSDEEGSAASKLYNKVAPEMASKRRAALMELQKRISADINASFVNKTLDVLIEGKSTETDLLLTGRSQFQGPEVDGVIYINKGMAEYGGIMPVKITESHCYDLIGEIV